MDQIESLIIEYINGNQLFLRCEKCLSYITKSDLNQYLRNIGCDTLYGNKKEIIKQLANKEIDNVL
jgi:hypothetical protein